MEAESRIPGVVDILAATGSTPGGFLRRVFNFNLNVFASHREARIALQPKISFHCY
jgi:hypothetical protein